MAPIHASGTGSSSLPEAKDQLWTFQLRKENKAMLQEIRSLRERRQSDYAEFEVSIKLATDNLAKVDARVKELEQKHQQDIQLQEQFREEIAALQSLMAETMASKYNQEEAQFILEGGLHPVRSVPNTPDRAAQMDRRLADNRQRRQLRVAERKPSRSDDHQFQKPPPRPVRRPQAQAEAGPSESRQHATRSRSRSRREPPSSSKPASTFPNLAPASSKPLPLPPMPTSLRAITPTPMPQRPVDAMPAPSGFSESQVPHLEQGNRSMREYYAKANSMYQALEDVDTDANFDVQYVSAFLRGIAVVKTREKLVDELRQFHPSRVMEHNWIDIICEWEDVEDAIHRAGLFVEVARINKRQGRFMNPRTMVETNI